MKLGDTLFNGNQFKNVILNSTSYKRLILGVNLVWSYFSIAIKSFKTRILADGGTYEGESILEDRLQEITPNLFDSASLVITPNGVKTSKLYTIKPNDGTGDLNVSRSTSATRIDENGNIVNVPANVARIGYSTGQPAILAEPQRTNLLQRSEAFDNAYWNKSSALNPVVLANSTVSPSSLTDADKITPSSNLTTHWIGKTGFTLVSGTTYAFSVFAKDNGYNLVLSVGNYTVYTNCNFNLNNGTASTPLATSGANLCSPLIQNFGNGWYRCTIIFTAWPASTFLLFSVNDTTSTPSGPFGMAAISGNNSKGFFLWGAQLEVGSNATSYIPTVASAVTRVEDTNNIILTNKSFWNKDNFTIYWEGTFLYNSSNQATFGFGNFTYIVGSGAVICFYNNGVGFFRKQDGTSPGGLTMGSPLPNGSKYKLIIKREGTEIKWFRNGVLLGVRTGEVVDYTYLGLNSGGSTYYLDKSFMIPSSLTDQECIALTTL